MSDQEQSSALSFRTFSELSQVEQDLQSYSDMFKDVHGFRPRGDYERFVALSEADRRAVLDRLYAEMAEQIREKEESANPHSWEKYQPDEDNSFGILAQAFQNV